MMNGSCLLIGFLKMKKAIISFNIPLMVSFWSNGMQTLFTSTQSRLINLFIGKSVAIILIFKLMWFMQLMILWIWSLYGMLSVILLLKSTNCGWSLMTLIIVGFNMRNFDVILFQTLNFEISIAWLFRLIGWSLFYCSYLNLV